MHHVVKVLVWGIVFWGLPLAVLFIWLGRGNVFVEEALFFSKAALVTFGGAYAVLAYVGQQAVEIFGWLKPDEMLTGLGLAETTPGPLILVLVFVGFMGAFRDSGMLDPMFPGALAAWSRCGSLSYPVSSGYFWVRRLWKSYAATAILSGALAAITAAVVGVIANLSFWFAIHVLFREVGEITVRSDCGGLAGTVLA